MPHDQWGASMRINVLFFSALFGNFMAYGLIPKVFEVRPVFYRERSIKMYNTLLFYVAYIITDIPGTVFNIAMATSIIYVLTGLKGTAEAYFTYLLVTITFGLLVSSFGQLLGNISPHPGIAFLAYGLVIVVMSLTAGFLVPYNQMPGWFSWFYYLSFTHYFLEAVVVNELANEIFTCPNNTGAIAVNFLSQATNQNVTQWFCPVQNGNDLIMAFDFAVSNLWRNYGILVGCYVGVIIVGAVTLRYLSFQKR